MQSITIIINIFTKQRNPKTWELNESQIRDKILTKSRENIRKSIKMATSTFTSKAEQQSPQHQTPTKASPSSSTAASMNPQQSPRNTSSGAMTTGTYVSFGTVEVSKPLQDGEKFVKWDEVRSTLE